MSDTNPYMAIRTTSKPMTIEYDVMFDRELGVPSDWQEELYTLRQANVGDKVNLRINCHGGSARVLSAIHNAVKSSQADIHAVLEGNADSAGSIIFLMGHTFEVSDYAEMMIHTAQGGYGGSSQAMESHGINMAKMSRSLIESAYKHFLTQEEIEDVLKGMEVHLVADEIKERLKKRQELLEEEYRQQSIQEVSMDDYAKQLAVDIMDDVEYMEFDAQDLVTLTAGYMTEIISTAQEAKANENPSKKVPKEITEMVLEDIPTEVFVVSVYDKILTISGTDEEKRHKIAGSLNLLMLKNIADDLNINYAHNIGAITLRNRILKYLDQ